MRTTPPPIAVLCTALLLALAPPDDLGAQEGGSGRIYLSGGLQGLEVAELNALLSERGLPTFSDDQLAVGLGLDGSFGGWRVGVEGSMLLGESETEDGVERSLGGRFAFLQAGYDLPVPGLRIYPLVGGGLGSLDLEATPEGPVEFGELLDGSGSGSDLSTGGILLKAGLGAEVPLGRARLGIRGGYVLSPGGTDWSVQGREVGGGPDAGIEGFYLRGVVGLGERP